MFGLSKELKGDKKEQPLLAQIADEIVTAVAATAGAVFGLTSEQSEAYIKDHKKIEEVADRVAIAQDLENISRTQQQDGLTVAKNTKTARAAQEKQELDLNVKTA